jgi:hypothetical protein
VPIPTRLVSNEEFPPLPQSAAQREVEARILAEAGRLASRLGLSRRDFLRTSGGMVTSFLAMNAVFGQFFNVSEAEAAGQAAVQELKGGPFFIFDVQLHYVGAGDDPTNAEADRKGAVAKGNLLRLRGRSKQMNPKLASDSGTLAYHSELLGQMIEAFGADHVLWGTDSIGMVGSRPDRLQS